MRRRPRHDLHAQGRAPRPPQLPSRSGPALAPLIDLPACGRTSSCSGGREGGSGVLLDQCFGGSAGRADLGGGLDTCEITGFAAGKRLLPTTPHGQFCHRHPHHGQQPKVSMSARSSPPLHAIDQPVGGRPTGHRAGVRSGRKRLQLSPLRVGQSLTIDRTDDLLHPRPKTRPSPGSR